MARLARGRGTTGRVGSRKGPSFRALIDVVPFGIDDPPAKREPVLRGVVPGIEPDAKVLVWAGGLWNWLDPLTVIRSVAKLEAIRDDVRLVFLGTRPPNPAVKRMSMSDRALHLADQLGVKGRTVFFNDDWVPYADRGAWLVEADIGVSAHTDHVETRFAFRTRLLDYIWASLPIVTTQGDVLADLVEERALGRTVGVGDVDGWCRALEDLLGDGAALGAMKGRVAAEQDHYHWGRVIEPLVTLLRVPGRRITVPTRIRANALSEIPVRSLLSIRHRGPGGALAHAAHRLDPRRH